MNYYQIYGIEQSLQIDKTNLRKQFLQLSKQYHPDNYMQATAAEQSKVQSIMEQINKGYKVLMNNDLHLQYYLIENDIIAHDEQFKLSPQFLMEMMDLNEEVEELTMAKNEAQIKAKQASIEVEKEKLISQIKELLANASEANKLLIKEYYYQVKYLDRLIELLKS